MATPLGSDDLKSLETRTLSIGFWLVGLAIAIATVSYVLNMIFPHPCGFGIHACNTVCHMVNLSLIGLATATAIQIHRGKPVGLVRHYVCHAL